jgi:hypothetical protein
MWFDVLPDQEAANRPIGAIVVGRVGDDVTIDAGPADGAPMVRLRLSRAQALQLSSNLRAVANGRDEEVLLNETS